MRRSRRLGVKPLHAVAAILVIGAAFAFIGANDLAIAETADPDDSGLLSVVVTDDSTPSPTPSGSSSPTPTPTPTPAPVRPAPSGGGTSPTATSAVTVATIADPSSATEALGNAEVIDGVLAVSGLTIRAAPWIDIGNGSFTVDFVIRNLSSTAFDSTAEFWVDNAFGGRIAGTDRVAVTGLQPDETRRVQVRFYGLGQQTLLHAHATLTPPPVLDGVDVEPISREASLLVPPWFSIASASGIALAGGATWFLLRRRALMIALRLPISGLAR